MYALLAEDNSDVETLRVLIRRLAHNSTLPIKGKGYGGCGEMLQKGARDIRLFAKLGHKRFVICYDADGPDPAQHRQVVIDKIIKPSGHAIPSCLALVPVQELEAWILADLHQAVPKVISSWKPSAIPKPETIASPKEHLASLSRGSNKKPRYVYAMHNSKVAEHLDLSTVAKKCPSFRPLEKFVVGHRRLKRPDQQFPASNSRTLWAYTNPPGGSQYVRQLAAPHLWGQAINFVQDLDERPEQLACLCEFGWAELEGLETEVQAILNAAKPKAQVRAILTVLVELARNRQEARFIGLDDGTR